MRPLDANFLAKSKEVWNIYFTEHSSPIFFTLHKGFPSIKDITIACRFVSIGLGVGNPSSYKICMNVNYLIDESLDK